jgi:hypothetical protein
MPVSWSFINIFVWLGLSQSLSLNLISTPTTHPPYKHFMHFQTTWKANFIYVSIFKLKEEIAKQNANTPHSYKSKTKNLLLQAKLKTSCAEFTLFVSNI